MQTLPPLALEKVRAYLLQLQKTLCQNFENIDLGTHFIEDLWQRPSGGGGITRILSQGQIFAKIGVNFSEVFGLNLPPAATLNREDLVDRKFHALGVSVVAHPVNPYVPTAHANVRFFVAEKENAPPIWWFGGGYDLTPYYGFKEDCKHWHQCAAKACEPFGENVYPTFKAWCDKYFHIKHRNEARGIGGLFFDDYREVSFEHSFALTQSIGNHFLPAYLPIVERRKEHPFGERELTFQRYRRGRYVEFNLVYDRGTLFGLQSEGRTESILMSLPPEAAWTYNWIPEKNSLEAKLYTDFLPIKDWLLE